VVLADGDELFEELYPLLNPAVQVVLCVDQEPFHFYDDGSDPPASSEGGKRTA
jgi:hypothetical protein